MYTNFSVNTSMQTHHSIQIWSCMEAKLGKRTQQHRNRITTAIILYVFLSLITSKSDKQYDTNKQA